jgi:hypothetical protein
MRAVHGGESSMLKTSQKSHRGLLTEESYRRASYKELAMTKRIAPGLFLCLLLGFAPTARADLHLVVEDPFDVGGGLTSYRYHLVADTADDIVTAVDLNFFGPMSQFRVAGVLDTPTLDSAALLGAQAAQDSHFMLSASDMLPITSPAETTDVLNGVFGVKASSQSMDLLIAQIVMSGSRKPTVVGQVARQGGELHDLVLPIGRPPGILADARILADPNLAGWVVLDGTGSCGLGDEGGPKTWLWDINGDGRYDDASGQTVHMSLDFLIQQLDIPAGRNSIGLMVIGDGGGYDFSSASIEVIPEPASLTFLTVGAMALLRRRRA